ncbi:MAG: hypothetical protein C0467_01420 [Planctomycetaceae bacterium]|nr:hypothetical protein [Planctomycetaceae bacterium]
MNNACPSCDAVYAVSAKDVGRKIRCKKCGTALRVDDSGLVEDADAADPAAEGDAGEAVQPRSKRRFSSGEGRAKAAEFINKVGGIPTALFGFGVFLTIWFFFQQTISAPNGASDNRAKAAALRVKLEQDQEIRKAEGDAPEQPELDADPKTLENYSNAKKEYDKALAKKRKDIDKKYKKPLNEANDDYTLTQIGNARGVWWDQYGLMFGFLFLSFGCIAYLRTDGNLVLRIVAGAILTLLFLVVFAKFSGCSR